MHGGGGGRVKRSQKGRDGNELKVEACFKGEYFVCVAWQRGVWKTTLQTLRVFSNSFTPHKSLSLLLLPRLSL